MSSGDFTFDLPSNIRNYRDADELFGNLSSFLDQSKAAFGGIVDELSFQNLVNKLNELKELNDSHPSKWIFLHMMLIWTNPTRIGLKPSILQ